VSGLSPLQRKQRLGLYGDVLPKVLFDLERFLSKVNEGAKLRSEDLSIELILLLLYPHQNLDQAAQKVLWQLLCKIQVSRVQALDIGQLYQQDTAYFFELYQSWSTKRQQWAQDYLKARGFL
jgi:hypothetical protein